MIVSTESNRFFLWSLFQSFSIVFNRFPVCFDVQPRRVLYHRLLTYTHHSMSSSSSSPSIVNQAVQSKLDQLNNSLPRLTQLLNRLQQSPDGPNNETTRTEINTLQSTIETDIATVQSLVDENVSYGQGVYENIQQPVSIANIDEVLLAGQQRFETVQHLAKESREAYLRQRKIMWLWVFLAIVLAGGAIYMYIWVSGLGGRTERTLASLPTKPAEIADTQAHSFSGTPHEPPPSNSSNIFAEPAPTPPMGRDEEHDDHDEEHDEDADTFFSIDNEEDDEHHDGHHEGENDANEDAVTASTPSSSSSDASPSDSSSSSDASSSSSSSSSESSSS